MRFEKKALLPCVPFQVLAGSSHRDEDIQRLKKLQGIVSTAGAELEVATQNLVALNVRADTSNQLAASMQVFFSLLLNCPRLQSFVTMPACIWTACIGLLAVMLETAGS